MICHGCTWITGDASAPEQFIDQLPEKINWYFEPFKDRKHILASTAREIYKEYWDDYFNFSFH